MRCRYAALVEYDGRPFWGFQRQQAGPSVQGVLENAFLTWLEQPVEIFASGRTDRGVHGTGQVIHFDFPAEMDPYQLRGALNYYTKPSPVVVKAVAAVPDNFNARFDALSRQYRYKIINRRSRLTFMEGLYWHIPVPLDLDVMKKAAQDFIGSHDFTTFRSIHCQARNPIRCIEDVYFEQKSHEEIHFVVRARSFLQHQIRSMIGTLERIGLHKLPPTYIQTALEAKDRTKCGRIAPPDGLYFEEVTYPHLSFDAQL